MGLIDGLLKLVLAPQVKKAAQKLADERPRFVNIGGYKFEFEFDELKHILKEQMKNY